MFKKIGDGLLIIFVLIVVFTGIMGSLDGEEYPDEQFDVPPTEQEANLPNWINPDAPPQGPAREKAPDQTKRPDNRRVLPPASPYDDTSIVQAEETRNWTSGTAFAIAPGGIWLTARHVVIGCDRVAAIDERGRMAAKVDITFLSDNADVAIARTNGGPTPLALDLNERDLKRGTRAFHVGFPQGKPGEVTSRLIGRELMVTEGAWRGREQTLAFAETGRTAGINGSLGGLSGGPAFDEDGNVIGITVAESPRRGRIVTTAAPSVIDALRQTGTQPSGMPETDIARATYEASADKLRADFKVIQLVCMRRR
jgi:serine protease Do